MCISVNGDFNLWSIQNRGLLIIKCIPVIRVISAYHSCHRRSLKIQYVIPDAYWNQPIYEFLIEKHTNVKEAQLESSQCGHTCSIQSDQNILSILWRGFVAPILVIIVCFLKFSWVWSRLHILAKCINKILNMQSYGFSSLHISMILFM